MTTQDSPPQWRNRIVGHGDVDPATIAPNPQNWRTHPPHQAAALRGVLEDVGVVQTVIVNQQTGNLVDGHLRVQTALASGQPTIPVVYVDLAPDEEALILATLDPLATMAGTNRAALTDLLSSVSTTNDALQVLLDQLQVDDYGSPPSLDDLAAQHGDPTERDFWPVVRVSVTPDTYSRFTELMEQAPGDDEAARFAALLAAVDAAALGDE